MAANAPLYKTHTATPLFVRLTPEHRSRLERAAAALGKSLSDFARDAVVAAVLKAEQERREFEKEEEARKTEKFIPRTIKASRGLGLKERKELPQVQEETPPTTIVVQAAASSTEKSDIGKYVEYVLAGGSGPLERDRRVKFVSEMLSACTKDKAEFEKLAKEFEDKLAEAEKRPKARDGGGLTAWLLGGR